MQSPPLSELESFVMSVRLGSVSAAARALELSQQTASLRVRSLERRLEIDLVQRSPRGVTPTASGEAVLAWAAEVLAAADRFTSGVESLRGISHAAALRVGASQTIAGHCLPRWILQLRSTASTERADNTDVELRTGNSKEVIAMLRAGTIDLGFIETPSVPRDLGSAVVANDQMLVAVAPSHEWARSRSVPLRDLAATPLVMRETGSGTRETLDEAVSRAGHHAPAEAALTLATEAAVRSAVAEGVAPAVLSELTLNDDVKLQRIVGVAIDPPLSRPFTAIWLGGTRDLRGVARTLVSIASMHGD